MEEDARVSADGRLHAIAAVLLDGAQPNRAKDLVATSAQR